jgi:polyferredoxin
MSGLLFYNIGTRAQTEITVQQVRQPLYTVLSDGNIRNRYQIHIVNKTEHAEAYTISAEGIPDSAIDLGNLPEIKVRAAKDLTLNLKINLSPEAARKTQEFDLIIKPATQGAEPIKVETNFSSPK